jgi:hypothetical protein
MGPFVSVHATLCAYLFVYWAQNQPYPFADMVDIHSQHASAPEDLSTRDQNRFISAVVSVIDFGVAMT